VVGGGGEPGGDGAGGEPGADERVQVAGVVLSGSGPGQGMPVTQPGYALDQICDPIESGNSRSPSGRRSRWPTSGTRIAWARRVGAREASAAAGRLTSLRFVRAGASRWRCAATVLPVPVTGRQGGQADVPALPPARVRGAIADQVMTVIARLSSREYVHGYGSARKALPPEYGYSGPSARSAE
jgi:hypothetical protein